MAANLGRHRVLIVGHSYVRRLRDFIFESDDPRVQVDFQLNEKLPGVFLTRFLGIGGARIARVIQEVTACIQSYGSPVSVVVLQVGGNDIDVNTIPQVLASEIFDAAINLHQHMQVQEVIISQLFFRDRARRPDYNDVVLQVNKTLDEKAKCYGDGIVLWRHKSGFWDQAARARIMLRDGVHFNRVGNEKYYKSLKSAVIQAMKKVLRNRTGQLQQ